MAQWSGQFIGNTHLSKVKDREQQLRHSIEVHSQNETEVQAQVVARLAKQLLDARIRATKARIAALDPRDDNARVQAESKIDKLQNGGVSSILKEFNASEICTDLEQLPQLNSSDRRKRIHAAI